MGADICLHLRIGLEYADELLDADGLTEHSSRGALRQFGGFCSCSRTPMGC